MLLRNVTITEREGDPKLKGLQFQTREVVTHKFRFVLRTGSLVS